MQIEELERQLARTFDELALVKGAASELAPAEAAAPPASAAAPGETSHKQAWRQLVNMGFNSVQATDVLAKCDGDVEAAMNELLSAAA